MRLSRKKKRFYFYCTLLAAAFDGVKGDVFANAAKGINLA